MWDEYWIWDKVSEEWNGWTFSTYERAEKYVMENGGFSRFEIFKKES